VRSRTRSLGCKNKEHTSVVTTGPTGFTRHSLRDGFNGFLRDLPGDRAFLPPSPARLSASLTSASGCQDHTTSPSAKNAARLATLLRPSHPALNVRDDAYAPLCECGTESLYCCFYGIEKRNIFCDRARQGFLICPSGQLRCVLLWASAQSGVTEAISLFAVTQPSRGLDPRVHQPCKKLLTKMMGCRVIARQRGRDGARQRGRDGARQRGRDGARPRPDVHWRDRGLTVSESS
jgi:hypothetical protein